MFKQFHDYERKAEKYFSKYPNFNAYTHLVLGLGLGFLIAYPVVGAHPVRWGIAFILLGIAGHLWAGQKTK